MMKRILLFDYDGVISDSLDVVFNNFNCNAKKFGVKEFKNKKDFVCLYDNNFFESAKKRGLTMKKVPEFLRTAKADLIEDYPKVKLFKGIKNVLKVLSKDNRIIIITSNLSRVIRNHLKQNKINFIKKIVGADKFLSKTKKIKIIKLFHPKSEIYYIGDTAGDVLEAKKAGVISIAVAWGYHGQQKLRSVKPSFLIHSPNELKKIFEK